MGGREKLALGLLVRCEHHVTGMARTQAHVGMQLDSGGRQLREPSGKDALQSTRNGERAPVVQKDVREVFAHTSFRRRKNLRR
jgi:hypothetical protein